MLLLFLAAGGNQPFDERGLSVEAFKGGEHGRKRRWEGTGARCLRLASQ